MIQERVINPNHRDLRPQDRFSQAAERMDQIILSAQTPQERLDLHRYSQNLLGIIAKPTKAIGESAFFNAIERQATFPQEFQASIWSITDTAREFFPGNTHIEILGLVQDLKRLTTEKDSAKKRDYHETYVMNYCRLRGMNIPEMTDYLTIISQTQRSR